MSETPAKDLTARLAATDYEEQVEALFVWLEDHFPDTSELPDEEWEALAKAGHLLLKATGLMESVRRTIHNRIGDEAADQIEIWVMAALFGEKAGQAIAQQKAAAKSQGAFDQQLRESLRQLGIDPDQFDVHDPTEGVEVPDEAIPEDAHVGQYL